MNAGSSCTGLLAPGGSHMNSTGCISRNPQGERKVPGKGYVPAVLESCTLDSPRIAAVSAAADTSSDYYLAEEEDIR